MGANWSKAPSSKINVVQPLTYSGSGTVFSTNFSPQTYQVRFIGQIASWVAVLQSTATMFSTATYISTAGGLYNGTFLAANTASGDYFAVNPGQILGVTSTATSSGILFSLAELS